jgi:hypothetical protein
MAGEESFEPSVDFLKRVNWEPEPMIVSMWSAVRSDSVCYFPQAGFSVLIGPTTFNLVSGPRFQLDAEILIERW